MIPIYIYMYIYVNESQKCWGISERFNFINHRDLDFSCPSQVNEGYCYWRLLCGGVSRFRRRNRHYLLRITTKCAHQQVPIQRTNQPLHRNNGTFCERRRKTSKMNRPVCTSRRHLCRLIANRHAIHGLKPHPPTENHLLMCHLNSPSIFHPLKHFDLQEVFFSCKLCFWNFSS